MSISKTLSPSRLDVKRHSDLITNKTSAMDNLATRLKRARALRGVTQAQLTKMAGLKNQSIIGSLESGHRKTSAYAPAIAEALGISAVWLSTGKGPMLYSCGRSSTSLRGMHIMLGMLTIGFQQRLVCSQTLNNGERQMFSRRMNVMHFVWYLDSLRQLTLLLRTTWFLRSISTSHLQKLVSIF